MSTIKDFDIDTLTLLLHEELNFVANAINQNQQESGFAIERMKLKMGQKHDVSDPFISVLDAARYPDEEDWEIELAYKAGDEQFISNLSDNSTFDEALLIEKFAKEKLSKIKGVSKSWLKKWSKSNVQTIGDLAKMTAGEVKNFAERHHSINPILHYSTVLTLNQKIQPLRFKQFSGITLEDVLINDAQILKRIFLNKLTLPEILIIQNQVRILFLAFDVSFVKKLTLAVFQ